MIIDPGVGDLQTVMCGVPVHADRPQCLIQILLYLEDTFVRHRPHPPLHVDRETLQAISFSILIPAQRELILAAKVGEELSIQARWCSQNSGIPGSLRTKVAITEHPFIFVCAILDEARYLNLSASATGVTRKRTSK
jgi:hypothetical protein